MYYTSDQIERLAPKAEAYQAGCKLAFESKWIEYGHSSRALWGKIKGSGSQPYFTQIDYQNFATKCTCPSRQFPCKHGIALLLIYAAKSNAEVNEEPEWVKEWIDKRKSKDQVKTENEVTSEEIEEREIAKAKRENDRAISVQAGVNELKLWLTDIIRRGLLELPSVPNNQFSNMAARMVDAKAPGLASWVKSLGKLNYDTFDQWYNEALEIIAKLHLILSAWKNYDKLSPDWQLTIKNLIGWSQSPKELLDDKDAFSVKDEWIVLGHEREKLDDIIIIRTWFWGIHANLSGIDLSFAINESQIENKYIPGSILKAEMTFFQGHQKQRCIVRTIRETKSTFDKMPRVIDNFETLKSAIRTKTALYPWLNNEAFILYDLDIIQHKSKSFLRDDKQNLIELFSSFDTDKIKRWILTTGNSRSTIALVIKGNKALPLGIFYNKKYEIL